MKWRNIALSVGLCAFLFSSYDVKVFAESRQASQFKSAQTQIENTSNDTESPKLEKLEVKFQDSIVRVSLAASDDLSGLADESNLCYVINDGGENVKKEITLKLSNGKYEGSADLSSNMGLWQIDFITLEDNAKNVTIIYNSKLHFGLGQDLSSGDITNFDTQQPQYIGLTTNIKDDKVNISVEAKDDVSGLSDKASLCYVLDSDTDVKKREVELTLSDGIYKGSIDMKDLTGNWKIDYIILEDKAQNIIILYNSNVHHGLGIDLSAGDICKLENKILVEGLNTKDDFKLGKESVAKVKVTNSTSEIKNATLIVGVYNANNRMFDLQSDAKALKSGESKEFNCKINIPQKGKYKVRIYVWDSIEGMQSISDTMEFEVSE